MLSTVVGIVVVVVARRRLAAQGVVLREALVVFFLGNAWRLDQCQGRPVVVTFDDGLAFDGVSFDGYCVRRLLGSTAEAVRRLIEINGVLRPTAVRSTALRLTAQER